MAAATDPALSEAHAPPPPAPPAALEVRGIVKHWPGRAEPVLDGLGLHLAPGTSLWIGGANGVGKTTLLRIVVGLLDPEAGSVRVGGLSLAADRVGYQRRIGFLSAGNSGLYARMTVRQHLAYWAAVAFVPRPERAAAQRRALEAFGLAELAGARVDRLSMGQRQRLRLALTFMPEPSLLLLDEPRTSLDVAGATLLADAIDAALARGAGVLWCSPDPTDLPRAFDGSLAIRAGRLGPW